MAKPAGTIQVRGTLGDLSFYDSVFGPIVRRKGGPSAKQIAKLPSFERVREHNAEFKECAASGKLLRIALGPLLLAAKDHRLVWRVTQLMSRIKNCDTVSERGQRTVATGLGTSEGSSLLKNFDFNSAAPLKKVLLKTPVVNASAGSISLKGLITADHLKAPKGTTHILLKAAGTGLDFTAKQARLYESETQILKLSKKPVNVVFHCKPTDHAPHVLYLLQVIFMQGINGSLYPLNNGAFNIVSGVGVE